MLKPHLIRSAIAVFLIVFSVKGLHGLQQNGENGGVYTPPRSPSENSANYPGSSAEFDSGLGSNCELPKTVSTSIEAELRKFKQVKMPFNSAGLTESERRMVLKLAEASQYLESIYWRQSDIGGLLLYVRDASCDSRAYKDLRRYLMIFGSRYDFENKSPLAKVYVPGHQFYSGATKAEIEAYVAAHPEKKAEIYSPFTVVYKQGQALVGVPTHEGPPVVFRMSLTKTPGKDLVSVPYHEEYRQWLKPAAKALREAADLSADKAFANFLRLRAEALLTDDYYKSDLAWVDLENPKFDVIFAPYETYLDDLLGVKTSYGGAVMIRNEAESRKLATYQQYVPDIQEALPLASEDKPSKRGHSTPMEVMDMPYRVGDLRHGYQAVADNLPNDPRIHQEKGTKKIFFKNYMDARTNYVVLPLAQLMMREDQARLASAEGYLATVLMHEIAHELGPSYARTSAGQKDIRESLGPVYGGLEEAKADITGLFGLNWLMEKGVLPRERAAEYYASHVAGIFRTLRFGVEEAHGRAEMMEFNYLSEQGAIHRESQSGRYVIDFTKMPGAIAALAKELLEIEATGDRERAEKWFQKYGSMPSELKSTLDNVHDVPVDIDPVSPFKEKVQ
jgi:hypothetical protein